MTIKQAPSAAARSAHLIDGDDQWKHDSHVPVERGAQQCAKLDLEHVRLVETHPDRAPTEEGIRLGWEAAVTMR